MKKRKPNALVFIGLTLIGTSILYFSSTAFNSSKAHNISEQDITNAIPEVTEPQVRFNINVDSYNSEDHVIERNEFLSTILSRYQVDPVTVSTLVKKSKPIFDANSCSVATMPFCAITGWKTESV